MKYRINIGYSYFTVATSSTKIVELCFKKVAKSLNVDLRQDQSGMWIFDFINDGKNTDGMSFDVSNAAVAYWTVEVVESLKYKGVDLIPCRAERDPGYTYLEAVDRIPYVSV